MAQSDTERQGDRDIEFGMKAIDKGYVAPVHLQTALRRLNERRVEGSRSSLAQILVEMELLSHEQAKEVLRELPTTELYCTNETCGSTFNVLAYDPGKKYACRHCKSTLRATDEEEVARPAKGGGDGSSEGLSVEADPRADLGAGDDDDDKEIQYSFAVPDDLLPGVESVAREDIFAKSPPVDDDVDPYAPPQDSAVGPTNEGEDFLAGVPMVPPPAETAPIPGLSTGGSDEDGYGGSDEPSGGGGGDGGGFGGFTPSEQPPLVEDSGVGAEAQFETGYDYNEGDQGSAAGTDGEFVGTAGGKQGSSSSGVVVLVLLLLLAAAGGGGYVLYEQLLASQPPQQDDEDDVEPKDEPPTEAELYAQARERLTTVISQQQTEARLDGIAQLLEEYDALIEARLARARLHAAQGHWEEARDEFRTVFDDERLPPGLTEVEWTALRSEAGFWLGLMLLLDEGSVEEGVKKQHKLIRAAEMGEGPFALASSALILQLRHRGDGHGDGYDEAWAYSVALEGRLRPLVQGLLLAWGALPGLDPTLAEDYDRALERFDHVLYGSDHDAPAEEEQDSENAEGEASVAQVTDPVAEDAPLAPLLAFVALLRGAYVSEPQPQRSEQELHRAQQQRVNEATVELYRAKIALRQAADETSDSRRQSLTRTAESLLERAFEAELPRAGLKLAELAYEAGDFSRAQELLERLPARIGTRPLQARIELELGHEREAIRLLEQVEVHSFETWSDLALAYLLVGRSEPAGRAIGRALRMRPDDPTLRARLGYATHLASQSPQLDEDRRFDLEDRAREQLAELLELYPENAEVHNWYGQLLISFRPLIAEGIRHLHRAVELDPRQWRTWLLLAQLHINDRNPEVALEVLEDAEPHIPTGQRTQWRNLRDEATTAREARNDD